MASEFDFLRVKWPKLAAMAADATRLSDVSPSSSLLSLRTYCEWATDIALDFYELQVAGGASQLEKLEALQASGMVPSEMLQKLHNVRSAASGAMPRDTESASELVHGCISDCLDIGQWLFREAEKEGWPHIDGYAQTYGSIPMAGLSSEEGGGYEIGKSSGFSMKRFMRKYGSIVSLVVVVIVLAAIGVGISFGVKGMRQQEAPPSNTFQATPTPSPTEIVPSTPTPEPTPEEDPFDYIDDIAFALNSPTFFTGKWNFRSNTNNFLMNGETYLYGLGMFIPSNDISGERGSDTVAWNLGGNYYKLTFDLGCDQAVCYDVREKYGQYRIVISADGSIVWESDRYDYDDVMLDMSIPIDPDTQRLELKLYQYKGSSGTLNVVMGDFKLIKNVEEETDD